MKINSFWVDLIDIPAKKEALVADSEFVQADISVGSPLKLFIFMMNTNIYGIKASNKHFI